MNGTDAIQAAASPNSLIPADAPHRTLFAAFDDGGGVGPLVSGLALVGDGVNKELGRDSELLPCGAGAGEGAPGALLEEVGRRDERGLFTILNCGLALLAEPNTSVHSSVSCEIESAMETPLTDDHVISISNLGHCYVHLPIDQEEVLRKRVICM